MLRPAAPEFATSIMLDPGSARCLEQYQAGTKKRRVVSRTKKHDELGRQGLPSKG
jgi:hypothetical protein